MKNKFTLLLFFIGTACVCFALVLLGYLAFRYQTAFTEADSKWTRAKMALTRNVMLYGVLLSADSERHILTIQSQNMFQKNENIVYRLPVSPDAFVGHQETLVSRNGITVVSSTTPLAPQAVWSLPPGTKLKFLVGSSNGASVIVFMLEGDPI